MEVTVVISVPGSDLESEPPLTGGEVDGLGEDVSTV